MEQIYISIICKIFSYTNAVIVNENSVLESPSVGTNFFIEMNLIIIT